MCVKRRINSRPRSLIWENNTFINQRFILFFFFWHGSPYFIKWFEKISMWTTKRTKDLGWHHHSTHYLHCQHHHCYQPNYLWEYFQCILLNLLQLLLQLLIFHSVKKKNLLSLLQCGYSLNYCISYVLKIIFFITT